MPFDTMPQGNSWGAWDDVCQGCKGLIAPGQPVEHIRFDPDPSLEQKLEEMNGPYHAECARPILSVKRALDALGRMPF
jgi:hypothetical protein